MHQKCYLQAMQLRRLIREFFHARGFLECETPVLVRTPGMEPNLYPFETRLVEWNGKTHPVGLITSPEFSLKKLLGAEFPKIFELARVFRNHEPFDETHNPEFTMLEWYERGMEYEALMEQTEALVRFCAERLGKTKLWVTNHETNAAHEVDVAASWERLSVSDAFLKYCGFPLVEHADGTPGNDALTRQALATRAATLGIHVEPTDSYDDIFFRIFLLKVEPNLGTPRPTILYDYPVSMAALARKKASDPRFAERFEVYVGGIELANAYGELTDPVEQRVRFLQDQEERRRLGKTVFPLDEILLANLEKIGQASGIALGVDRLAMILTEAKHINEVLAFSAKDLFA